MRPKKHTGQARCARNRAFRIWIGRSSQSILTAARKIGPPTAVPGSGDDACLQANGSSFVELYVKLGDRRVHGQKSIPFTETFASLKPAVLALGRRWR